MCPSAGAAVALSTIGFVSQAIKILVGFNTVSRAVKTVHSCLGLTTQRRCGS
jgi:hypothetical protein